MHVFSKPSDELPDLFANWTRLVLFLCLGLALDLFGRLLAHQIALPVRLNSIGTFFVAISLGPFFGSLTGAAGALLGMFLFDLSPWYILICACSGLFFGLPFVGERRKNAFTILTAALITGLLTVVISIPILLRFLTGYTDNLWGDAMVDMMNRNIQVPTFCCMISEAFVDMPDKLLAATISSTIFLSIKKRSDRRKRIADMRAFSLILLVVSAITASALLPARVAHAAFSDYRASYESILYNEENGLLSIECNAIAQTPDGYLWVGTYSGLYRYDGSAFEAMQLDERINNVMQLYTDADGRLWIGTNDSGIACYSTDTQDLKFYGTKEGMAADAIRAICEDSNGSIYVGTVSSLSVISPDGTVATEREHTEPDNTRSLAADPNGQVCGVTNNGILYFMEDGAILSTLESSSENVYYTAVAAYGDGRFLVGLSDSSAEIFTYRNGALRLEKKIHTAEFSYFNKILRTEGGFFFCAENGPGFLSDNGAVTDLRCEGFTSAMSDVILDTQGDVWFSSAKHGILKYAKNPFYNLSRAAGLSDSVVNAILIRGSDLLVGTDDGLVVLDKSTGKARQPFYADALDGDRIRHMMLDSNENVWISTYSQDGLVCIGSDGTVTNFTEADGTLGGRFRSALELSDGRILVASSEGLSWIRNGAVETTLGVSEGLATTQILSLVERDDGSILAASDGDGIYVIRDDKIVDRIGTEEGLGTLVVLRIVPHGTGLLYVTSNALYYDDGTKIRQLEHFPYNNNYDVYFDKHDTAWISSSAGIYLVSASDLIADEQDYHYTLLNRTRGLYTTLTANAWNTVDEDTLYLCCSDGLRSVSTETFDTFDTNYQIRLNAVTGDEEAVPIIDDTYVIPRDAKRIRFDIAVLNFTLSNPLLRIYLEGTDDTGMTCRQNELTPLSYTNLPHGTYTLHVQVLDDTTEAIARDITFSISKDAQLFERTSFRIYLAIVCAIFAIILAWIFVKLNNMAMVNRQYDQIRAAKEAADEANQAKSRFLTHISQEIRTPIDMITGINELNLRGQTSAIVRDRSLGIKRATDSLLRIIDDTLDLSRIESGKVMIQPQDYETFRLLHSVSTIGQLRCDKAGLTFRTVVDPQIPDRLFGDDVRIKQILINLLSNAIKYTENGSVTFSVALVSRDEDRARVCFSVTDTGIGIKKRDQKKLFDAFERFNEPVSRNLQGAGLGLNIAQHLAHLMGGEIICKSIYGEGSTFSLYLDQRVLRNVAIIGNWQQELISHTEPTNTPTIEKTDDTQTEELRTIGQVADHDEQLTREIMLALSEAVDAKDHYTNGHSQRVARYASRIAYRLGLSPSEQDDIYSMGLLHDIGKIGVPESIINKSTRLTEEEFETLRNHTTIGYEILKNIKELPGLATCARWHHERYDGNGYPDGLSGAEIPLEARIICVADAYDAMSSNRSYSSAREQHMIRDEIVHCRGRQFDPEIADILIQMIDEDTEYLMREQ